MGKQPWDEESRALMQEALAICPVEAIGKCDDLPNA